ncbi:MAG: hypothetical protein WA915_05345, partial [Candidatus Aminicenantaceae bacterium]
RICLTTLLNHIYYFCQFLEVMPSKPQYQTLILLGKIILFSRIIYKMHATMYEIILLRFFQYLILLANISIGTDPEKDCAIGGGWDAAQGLIKNPCG